VGRRSLSFAGTCAATLGKSEWVASPRGMTDVGRSRGTPALPR